MESKALIQLSTINFFFFLKEKFAYCFTLVELWECETCFILYYIGKCETLNDVDITMVVSIINKLDFFFFFFF